MWSTGQPWRVVGSLIKLNEQIRAYAPRSVPPATDVNAWGSIADNAHSTSSDHYPHYYSVLGSTAVVCARDFPHAPSLGLDGHTVTEWMRTHPDPRVQYIIFDGRITGVNYGWQWHDYTGDDQHETHFHVSSKHTAAVDSTAAWSLPGSVTAATDNSPLEGDTMIPILRVTGIDNNSKPLDIRGNAVPNQGLVLATPNGRVSVIAAWWGSMDPSAPGGAGRPMPVIMTVTWAEALELCDALKQTTTAVVDASAVASALVADAAFGDLVEARAFAAAQHAESA